MKDESQSQQSNELEALEKDAAEVTSVSQAELKNDDSKETANTGFAMRAGIALIALGLLFGLGFFLGTSEDGEDSDASTDTTVTGTTDTEEAASSVTVESIRERVESGEQLWGVDQEAILEAAITNNSNVTYVFSTDVIDVMSNGLPTHETGAFPNANNPNSISEQSVSFSIPRTPTYNGTPTDARTFGYSLGGVKIEPGTAERDPSTNAPIEAFNTSGVFDPGVDENNAHVQPDGTYHYHGLPSVLVTTGEEHSNIIGFAVDGFPIYGDHAFRDPTNSDSPIDHMTSSWRLKSGERPAGKPSGIYNGDYTTDFEFVEDSGDLDRCNGRFTVTPEFPEGTYAYFVTEQFPFFGRCVMGEVASGFELQGSPAQQGGAGQQGPPPTRP